MTLLFQIILIAASIILATVILRRVARSKAKIEDSIFWLALCVFLVALSIFPEIANFLASLIGVYSPINFIFLFFIFIIIVKLFFSSIRISKLEMQSRELAQSIAIAEKNLRDLQRKLDDASDEEASSR